MYINLILFMSLLTIIVGWVTYKILKAKPKTDTTKTLPIQTPKLKKIHKNINSHRKKREASSLNEVYKDRFKEFSGAKILLAEDDEINQKVLLGLLDGSGVEVDVANDGLEALELLKIKKYALILMDSHMPNMGGMEATRAIRANNSYSDIPIVSLSGDVMQNEIDLMFSAGVDEYLQKPLKPKALYDVLYAFELDRFSKNIKEDLLDGFDTKSAMELLDGDGEFYKNILRDFTLKYLAASSQINQFLKEGSKQKAQALLLDIVGISANIGAINLHQRAAELQEALHEHKTLEFIAKLKEFERELLRTIKTIHIAIR